eukprot:Colp12_sorted_trinity150504_noHs@31853
MGPLLSSVKPTPITVLLLGLDSAGKTSLLQRIVLKRNEECAPTEGHQIQLVKQGDHTFQFWDFGGSHMFDTLSHTVPNHVDAVCFVVDSTAHQRFFEAKKAFDRLLKMPELQDAYFVVLANKQDVPGSASPKKIAEIFKLEKLDMHIHPVTAYGEGIATVFNEIKARVLDEGTTEV